MSDTPNKNNDQQSPNQPKPPLSRMPKGMMGWMMFFGMAMLLFLLLSQSMQHPNKVDVQQLKTLISQNRVSKITISGNTILGELKPDKEQTKGGQFQLEVLPGLLGDTQFYRDVGLVNEQGDWTVPTSFDTNRSVFYDVLIGTLPWLLVFGFIWFFVFRQLRMSAGGAGMLGNFGRSGTACMTKEHTNVTFDDVAGIEEAKEEVSEIIEFLKNPQEVPAAGRADSARRAAGRRAGLRQDAAGQGDRRRGGCAVLQHLGQRLRRDVRGRRRQPRARPVQAGQGKLARASSSWTRSTPSAGSAGRALSAAAHDEREQTLNAILVEMDGFDTDDQVIVIAATNRADVLDPALTRPGRFDRQVFVPLPDVKGRLEILQVHAQKVKMGPDVDLERLARGTPMFSGADLAAIINEAAIIATMANKDYVEMEDLEEARDKVRWGRAKKSRAGRREGADDHGLPRGRPRAGAVPAAGRRPAAQGEHHSARAVWRGDVHAAGEGPDAVHAEVLPGDAADLLRRPDRRGDVLRRHLQRGGQRTSGRRPRSPSGW